MRFRTFNLACLLLLLSSLGAAEGTVLPGSEHFFASQYVSALFGAKRAAAPAKEARSRNVNNIPTLALAAASRAAVAMPWGMSAPALQSFNVQAATGSSL